MDSRISLFNKHVPINNIFITHLVKEIENVNNKKSVETVDINWR